MTKTHTCYVCKKTFINAIYWYDSIHDSKYDKRLIKPFCSPACANKFREISDENSYPLREKPWPRGPQWQIIQDINYIDYESD